MQITCTQAQPNTPDECFRFSFVTEMVRQHILFGDGDDVLWTKLPHCDMEFCYNDSNEFKDYDKNVATPTRNIFNVRSIFHEC